MEESILGTMGQVEVHVRRGEGEIVLVIRARALLGIKVWLGGLWAEWQKNRSWRYQLVGLEM